VCVCERERESARAREREASMCVCERNYGGLNIGECPSSAEDGTSFPNPPSPDGDVPLLMI
jgi:hypothetical protein